MRDDPAVVALVAAAGEGDRGAWNELAERYAPLVSDPPRSCAEIHARLGLAGRKGTC